MTFVKIAGIFSFCLMLNACSSSKKGAATATVDSLIPTETQVTAMKTKYPDLALPTLIEGHSIYVGACTNCHGQKNIYKRSEESWLHEIDEMAPKAKLTPTQKEALTKYILSMKATAPVSK